MFGGKERSLKGGKRERGHVSLMGSEGTSGREAHGLPHGVAHVASWHLSPLSHTLRFFSHILGIRTPISNLFSDYES